MESGKDLHLCWIVEFSIFLLEENPTHKADALFSVRNEKIAEFMKNVFKLPECMNDLGNIYR